MKHSNLKISLGLYRKPLRVETLPLVTKSILTNVFRNAFDAHFQGQNPIYMTLASDVDFSRILWQSQPTTDTPSGMEERRSFVLIRMFCK